MIEEVSPAEPDFESLVGPALAKALTKKGFVELTNVQKTVLDPALADRDLRITSQTGSGKTVAIGFALRELVHDAPPFEGGPAKPRAIVVAPTRELAKQVEQELTWLYSTLGARVASATGGASIRDERRALATGPAVVVGTPGRLLDHLDRGAIDPSGVSAVVLDEADRLLDLGFREELDRILDHAPEGHRTHLVSATFPREVRALADAVQADAAHVEGTRLGQANTDIDHVLYLVDARDKFGAIVNLLLANPDEQMLIFARTRIDVADIADALVAAGFSASGLSGEMEQPARDRALAAFKRGDLRALVATDVAARGIDVQDIGRVLHADPPGDADTYTHRSGRTGRAGRKGTSAILVPPSVMARVVRLVTRARVPYRFEKLPSKEAILRAEDERLIAAITADEPGAADADPRITALAERLAKADNVERTIARLLARAKKASGPEPYSVREIEPPKEVVRPSRRNAAAIAAEAWRPAPPRDALGRGAALKVGKLPKGAHKSYSDAPPTSEPMPGSEPRERPERGSYSDRPRRDLPQDVRMFQVSWGEVHGADSRRMLAMLCRRGGISSGDVGAIRIGRVSSTVEIAADVAELFAASAGKTDMRDPRIVIRPFSDAGKARGAQKPVSRLERPSFGPSKERPSFHPAARTKKARVTEKKAASKKKAPGGKAAAIRG